MFVCLFVFFKDAEIGLGLRSPHLWLAASADRRVSVWSADWPKDSCEMVDWLSFPAPAFAPDGTVIRKGDIVSIYILYNSVLSINLLVITYQF